MKLLRLEADNRQQRALPPEAVGRIAPPVEKFTRSANPGLFELTAPVRTAPAEKTMPADTTARGVQPQKGNQRSIEHM